MSLSHNTKSVDTVRHFCHNAIFCIQFSMKQKTIVIVGASRGIGKALLKLYAKSGYTVIGTYNKNVKAAQLLSKKFDQVTFIHCNLAKLHSVRACAKKISRITPSLDIVINNAGIYTAGGLQQLPIRALHNAFGVNVTGKFLLTQLLLPLLNTAPEAKVVFISSRFGFFGNVEADSLSYTLSNSALIMLSRSLQEEFLHTNIRIGCFIPTVTKTDRFTSAFTREEQMAIQQSKLLAQPIDTARKIKAYTDSLRGVSIGVDARVPNELFHKIRLETV